MTNREKLEELRQQLRDCDRRQDVGVLRVTTLDLLALLLGADGPRSPVAELQPGDVVRLRSGGPAMTVAELGKEATVISGGLTFKRAVLCSWFDAGGVERHAQFAIGALLVDDKEQRVAKVAPTALHL